MTQETGEAKRARLRRAAEAALDEAETSPRLRRILTQLVDLADEGTDDWIFAHRHLAEVLLEEDPWRAALHLRRVLVYARQDDVVHALMGLCHALLGHYRAAVASYRRALDVAPHMPWYHHNLGHLLDVALAQPERAEGHLRRAHRMEPGHDEITASLAHCVARLGRLEEALELAEEAVDQAPRNEDHRKLLDWILEGAPDRDAGPLLEGNNTDPDGRARKRAKQPGAQEPTAVATPKKALAQLRDQQRVRAEFERRMAEAGFSPDQLDMARSLWFDFQQARTVRIKKPEVYAAAVEYAIALLHGESGVTQAKVARRYGVAPGSVSSRWGEIRDALALEPFDPRYAR